MELQKRVMFVDDEEGVRTSWDRFLSNRGFQVLTAHDGESAISKLQTHPVDVVVSDFRMPTGDGLKLLAWIKEQQPDTRFILLTGYGNDDVEQRARELGAYEYLNKPISPETLEQVIRTAMQLELLPGKTAEPAAAASVAGLAEIPEAKTTEAAAVSEAVAAVPVEAVATAAAVEAAPAEETVVEAEVRKHGPVVQAAQTVGGLIAAPLMGLAFVIFLPVIGFAALFWSLARLAWGAVHSVKASV